MKIKKVVMAICATLLAAVSFGVAACSGCNSCTHSATCEHTDEVADRAEHVYVDGLCSVCGAEEPFRLKEDTDFDALISDKVTAEEWQAAFDEENFKNVDRKSVV